MTTKKKRAESPAECAAWAKLDGRWRNVVDQLEALDGDLGIALKAFKVAVADAISQRDETQIEDCTDEAMELVAYWFVSGLAARGDKTARRVVMGAMPEMN